MSPITTDARRQMGESLLNEISRQQPNMEQLRFFLRQGADLCVTDARGNNAPILISSWGNRELLKEMLDKGADVNHKGENGNTLLHLIVAGGNKVTVKMLLAHGADVTIRNNKGQTPGDSARSWGEPDMADLVEKQYRAQMAAVEAREQFEHAVASGLPVEVAFPALKPLKFKPPAP